MEAIGNTPERIAQFFHLVETHLNIFTALTKSTSLLKKVVATDKVRKSFRNKIKIKRYSKIKNQIALQLGS